MLILDRHDMETLLDMGEVIAAIAAGFRELQEKGAQIPLRFSLDLAGQEGVILYMPAYLPHSQRCGTKVVSVFPRNLSQGRPTIYSAYLLHDPATGELLALMEGGSLTGLRTGGASALASRYLARDDASVLGIIGAGFQAYYQVKALMAVRPLKELWAYDNSRERLAAFCRKLEGIITVYPAANVDQVLKKSDILVTATTSPIPVFSGRDVKPGTHINAIGAFRPSQREVDFETIERARVVVDTYEGCLSEAGEIMIPLSEGRYRREDIHAELGELVTGKKGGRQSPLEITFFKSVGHALEDVVVASLAYQKAQAGGYGRQIELLPNG